MGPNASRMRSTVARQKPPARLVIAGLLFVAALAPGCRAGEDAAPTPGAAGAPGTVASAGNDPGAPAADGAGRLTAGAGVPTPAPPPPKPGSPAPGRRAMASTIVPAPPTSAPDPAAGVGRRVLRYRSVEVTVPDWPVYDLERDPRRCVRWDPPAIYLGRPGADQDCPAAAVGATGGVLLQPLPPGRLSTSTGERAGSVAGHPAYFEGDPDESGQLVVRIPDLGVGVIVELGGSRRFGDDVLNSIKEAKA